MNAPGCCDRQRLKLAPSKRAFFLSRSFKPCPGAEPLGHPPLPGTLLQAGIQCPAGGGKRPALEQRLWTCQLCPRRQKSKYFFKKIICCCRSRWERSAQQSLVRTSTPSALTSFTLLCSQAGFKKKRRKEERRERTYNQLDSSPFYSPAQRPDPFASGRPARPPASPPATLSHERTMQRGWRRALQSCPGTLSLPDTSQPANREGPTPR